MQNIRGSSPCGPEPQTIQVYPYLKTASTPNAAKAQSTKMLHVKGAKFCEHGLMRSNSPWWKILGRAALTMREHGGKHILRRSVEDQAGVVTPCAVRNASPERPPMTTGSAHTNKQLAQILKMLRAHADEVTKSHVHRVSQKSPGVRSPIPIHKSGATDREGNLVTHFTRIGRRPDHLRAGQISRGGTEINLCQNRDRQGTAPGILASFLRLGPAPDQPPPQ